eukprot:NODE_2746_length_1048_cov_46.436436_g2292_i0.p2 GENE.NODE_2746_length_1048_cov_46.436436_g2292_i0~~NODE_2746_length_1048_cov_46.436436_g2292_i0.p2  ORF type:complete len:295 (+),score=87.00 NODE_2746_length_1048_cov_46.436436_g2292_i0:71-955(+)
MTGLALAVAFCGLSLAAAAPLPVVLWHGMGDTCCFPFSMGAVKDALMKSGIPYVYSVEIGGSMAEDEVQGFLSNVNGQVSFVCDTIRKDPKLRGGFNGIGFSQGGQFLRAAVQRCGLPITNLITFGGQHQGVADIPGCMSTNATICKIVEELLSLGAYAPGVRDIVVQAQYFKDPMQRTTYLQDNIFMPDINNEGPNKNSTYRENLMKLKNFVMIMFTEDITVVPRESEWFGYYKWGSTSEKITYNETQIYQQDWIGLKYLDEQKRLTFKKCPGAHMQFSMQYLHDEVTVPYLL